MKLPLDRLPPPRPSLGGIPFREVLREGEDETARLIWTTLRAADLRARVWAGGLFDPDAYVRHLRAVRAGVTDGGNPDGPDGDSLADALVAAGRLLREPPPNREVAAASLTRLGLRAEAVDRPRSALACFEAAARLVPGDPERSLVAGRTARDESEWARAERWLDRSVLLARRTERWDCYVRALGSRGVMEFRQGRLPRARTSLTRGLNRARREGLAESRGIVAHDLITVELEEGMVGGRRVLPEEVKERAEVLAREAFEAYGPLHHSIYRLAHDTAFILALRRRWHEALPVFQATVERAPTKGLRAIGWAGVAWSAAHLGREALYREAMDEVERGREEDSSTPRILLEASEAALQMREWERAERLNRAGLELAEQRRESKVRADLEGQLERITVRREEPALDPVGAPRDDPGPARPWVRALVSAVRERDVGRERAA